MSHPHVPAGNTPVVEKLWYTRCPVPTASGIAYAKGWLGERFAQDGVEIGILQDAPLEIARHHYDHHLNGLLREGGNVPALVARSNGSPTRLIGLTWIDERQAIVTRAGEGEGAGAAWLVGRRLAVPGWAQEKHASHARAMALRGFEAALGAAGARLVNAVIVEVPLQPVIPPGHLRPKEISRSWPALDVVANGLADAAYVKGAAAMGAARDAGLRVVVEIDAVTTPIQRVNNGTPRPLTVHEALLQYRPEWVVAFLALTLRAARWAGDHPTELHELIARETGAAPADVAALYPPGVHAAMVPDLSDERLALLQAQRDFLLRQGYLGRDFDLGEWRATELLEAARHLA